MYWLQEYLIDHFIENPLEVHRNPDGEIQFTETGDSLIDEWEEVIAEGGNPDLMKAFSPEIWEKLRNRSGDPGLGGMLKNQRSIADTVARFSKNNLDNSGIIERKELGKASEEFLGTFPPYIGDE